MNNTWFPKDVWWQTRDNVRAERSEDARLLRRHGDRVISGAEWHRRRAVPVDEPVLTAGGRDDVSKSHVVWKKSLRSYVPSPVLAGEHILSVNNDGGVLTGLSVKTGEQVFQHRLSNAGSIYASPVVIDGKIYVVTRRNGTFVVGVTGSKVVVLGENHFEDETDFNASPAVTDGKLLLRSNRALYCIGDKPQ